MRNLVYWGKDNLGTIVKTTDYEEMLRYKEQGFKFKEVMEEITKEYKTTERAKKIAEKMRKRA